MDGVKMLYAIFTLDAEKQVDGVYIGSTNDLAQRIRGHFKNKNTEKIEAQRELHDRMRAGDYVIRRLNSVSFQERWQEYDWIRFFRDYTPLKIYNILVDCHPGEPDPDEPDPDEEGGA